MIYLKHLEGSKKGQVESFDLERIRIGRQADNDLKFNPETDREVSSHHAEILCQGDAVLIEDLQSRNGTCVNGRRINQPTRLAEGDTIQFSPRGPKVIFSIGAPVAGSGTVAAKRHEAATPQPKTGFAGIGTRRLIALGGVALVVLVALGFAVWWSWTAFLIILGILLVLVSAGLVALWWRRRRKTRLTPSGGTPEVAPVAAETPADLEALKELRDKWTEALTRLQSSNLKQLSEDALYAVPWLLILGERGSGKTEAIRAGNPPASLASAASHQAISGTRSCDWWFFDNAVLLDTPGRYSFPVHEAADGKEWREVLSLLKRSRGREPINGVIVTVAADALASRSVESLQDGASQLRRRLDEMVQHLGSTFPVYVLLTKTDLISGFTEFFGGLPDSVRGQAMGVVNEAMDGRVAATVFLKQAFALICERLDRVRLAVMDNEDRQDVLRNVCLLPEEFRRLHKPFLAFADALFRPTRYHETPFCRGVFFTSSKQHGRLFSLLSQAVGFQDFAPQAVPATGSFFGRDIFSMVLPQDRPLVRRTAQWRERYRRGQRTAVVAGAAISLVLCGLLTLSFARNSLALSRLNIGPCLNPTGPASLRPLARRLTGLDGCRDVIAGLTPHSLGDRLITNFGLRQAERLEGPLKERYLQTFQQELLGPLDALIDRRLAPGPTAPVFAGVVLQRISLVVRCQSRDGCPDLEDQAWPNYRVMLAAEDPNVQEGDPLVGQLRRTHGAFLRWQADTRALEEMRVKDIQRVSRWLNSGGLRTEWILASARAQFPPVQLRDFWGWDGPAQVDPPFTERAWKEGIQPLLSGLRAMASEAKEVQDVVAKFEADYRVEGLRQWGHFLAGFPRGERVLTGGGRELALKTLGPTSPYGRVIDMASSDLATVLGSGGQAGDAPSWAGSLQRYVALKAKVAEAQKSTKEKPEDLKAKYREEERQAIGYLTGYLEALEQLRGELGGQEKSFRSAQRVFEEGEPTEKAAHPIQKALWNLKGLRAAIGAREKDDQVFWSLLARPVELAWRVMLDEAGLHLQAQWEGLWLELAELTPGQRLAKVVGFANGQATGFLERSRDRYLARQLLNEHVNFTPTFLAFISRVRWISPDNPGRLDAPRQIVASR